MKNVHLFLYFAIIFFAVNSIDARSLQSNSTNYGVDYITYSSGGNNMSSANYKSSIFADKATGNLSSSTYKQFLGIFYHDINVLGDMISPDISNEVSTPTMVYSDNDVMFNATINDSEDNLKNVWLARTSNGSWQNTTVSSHDGSIYYFVIAAGNFSEQEDVQWRYYANDSAGNIGQGSVQSFTVQKKPPSTSFSGGGGQSSEGAAAKTPKGFYADTGIIKIALKQGEIKTYDLFIENKDDSNLRIDFDFGKLKKYVKTFDDYLILKGGEKKKVTFVFAISVDEKPDLIVGNIMILSDINIKAVQTILEITSKEPLFDARLKIQEDYKKVAPGSNLPADITLTNLGDLMNIDVEMEYLIKDMEGNVIDLSHETFAIEKKKSFSKIFKLPSSLKEGDYVLYIKATYEDKITTASDFFSVRKPILESPYDYQGIWAKISKIYNEAKKYIILLIIILITSAISSIVWIMHYKKKIIRKKKK